MIYYKVVYNNLLCLMKKMKPGPKLRIVLLDDNDVLRSILSEVLAGRGHEVLAFSNPAICPMQLTPECRCKANQTCTDIILSDLEMPKMTGLGFIENQKKKNCKCQHVVLMSGNWTEHDLQRAHELGCKTLAKPFSLDEFLEWLDEVKRGIESTRELCTWFNESAKLSYR
jgi:CheY-like chemotaxis protein